MHSSAAYSRNTSFETSSNAFSRSRKIVAERDLYPLLRAVIGAAVCISVAMASIVPTSVFLGMPAMRTRRMAGAVDKKSG